MDTRKARQIKSIANNVLLQCIRNDDQSTTHYKFDTTFAKYTGVMLTSEKMRRAPITFDELLHLRDNHPIVQSNCLSITLFRQMLKKLYLTERKIPSLDELNNFAADEKCLCSEDTGKVFVLKTLPGLTKGIIVESPEIVYKRMLYLKKMEQIRKNNNHIIYVKKKKCAVNIVCDTVDTRNDLFLCVSSRQGLLKAFFYNANDPHPTKWLLESISTIADPCVIVMEEQDYAIPTSLSPKADMSNWLTANGIVHDPKTHRGELYELINKVKANVNLSNEIDDVAIALGHQIVRYPVYTEELDFFRKLHHLFLDSQSKHLSRIQINKLSLTAQKNILIEFIKSVNLDKWQQLETELVETETLMYQEDMMMEKIVDNLSMMVADGEAPDDMLKSLIDATDWKKVVSSIIVE